MKALRFYGVKDVRLDEVPVPSIGADEVLVRVAACAICGTDLRTLRYGHTRIKEPRIIGHEFSGIIVEVGSGVKDFRVGERVMVVPGIACGSCYYCRHGWENLCQHRKIIGFDLDGGFAEYVRIPAEAVEQGNIKKLPEDFSLEAGCLIEPFTAVYNAQELVHIKLGDTVGVIGAGPVGIMHFLQAKARGAGLVGIIEVLDERLQKAKGFGPDFVVNSRNTDVMAYIKELTNGLGLDVVIVACSSAEAQRQALELVRPGGKVSFFAGLPHSMNANPINTNLIHYKQLYVLGANGSGANQYDATINFLARSTLPLASLITYEVSLEDALEGFGKAEKATELKIVIKP